LAWPLKTGEKRPGFFWKNDNSRFEVNGIDGIDGIDFAHQARISLKREKNNGFNFGTARRQGFLRCLRVFLINNIVINMLILVIYQ
jgi:hypothetical protein